MTKYVDADALMDELSNQFRDMDNNVYDSQDDALEDAEVSVRQIIYNMPAADVEPVRHGKWTDPSDDDGGTEWYCSVCGYAIKTLFYPSVIKYCENCGAKMDGGSNEL